MKGFDVLHVKSAVKSHSKIDLSHSHLTTLDFGQIVPLLAEETIPGDKFAVGADFFSRTAPLVKPTYGKFSFKTVTGFVPYHQVAFDADAWIEGRTVFEGVTPLPRYITFLTLHNFVVSYCTNSVGATYQNADYIYMDGVDPIYLRFTARGRYYVKVLNSLGYSLPQGVNIDPNSDWTLNVAGTTLSAYPLLAFCKLYNDYMSQSTRFNVSTLSEALLCIKYGRATTGYNVATGEILPICMSSLLSAIRLNYESDYFTTAWAEANTPIYDQSINSVQVPSTSETITSDQNAVVVNSRVSGNVAHISQRALDWLRAFDDWVRRNNYSGSRTVQQVYSRFGIKTDDYKTHYAHVYKTDVMPVQVGDVTSVAGTDDASLGDYAGKAIMSGYSGFDGDFSDYGLFMILGYMTVKPMYAYGCDKRVLRSHPLDYYTPEFDGVGAEPISLAEVYQSPIAGSGDPTLEIFDTSIFGFTERYNSYRFSRDVITGDFRNYRNDSEMNTWHTGRNLTDVRDAGQLVAQNASVNCMEPVESEYNRIFSVVSSAVDHFYLTCNFNVSAIRPMKNLNQVVNLGEGDTTVPRNGEVIS